MICWIIVIVTAGVNWSFKRHENMLAWVKSYSVAFLKIGLKQQPLLFFQLKVEYSKVLLCEQTHRPITITVQQQTSGLPNNNNNSINHNGWQAPYVFHSNKCCLTNETQIIQKTTYGKPSPIIWTARCSVFSDEASNCPTVILKWAWNRPCFNSIMSCYFPFLCFSWNWCHGRWKETWSELHQVTTLTERQSENLLMNKHLWILFLLYNISFYFINHLPTFRPKTNEGFKKQSGSLGPSHGKSELERHCFLHKGIFKIIIMDATKY